jgi:hypothetical protein
MEECLLKEVVSGKSGEKYVFSVCKNAQKTPPFLAPLVTARLWNGNHLSKLYLPHLWDHFVASMPPKKQS